MRGGDSCGPQPLRPLGSPVAGQGTVGLLKPDPFLSSSFLLWVDDTPGASGFAAVLRGGWLPLSGLSASHTPDIFPFPKIHKLAR